MHSSAVKCLLSGGLLLLLLLRFTSVASQGIASKRCEFMDNAVARCTEKFLISAQLDGLPLGLRVLNLDRNQISSLENNVFWKTPLLQDLSIAQNRLDTIYMDAFADLKSLKRLNLSHNRLESFNEFLLDNLAVEVLDLSGNNFMYSEGKLAFKSSSLMELYLKSCKIVSLNGMLKSLPSLQKVDLSSNLLVSLDLPSFVPLVDLKFVDLENNFLRCDKPTQYLMEWFRKHAIEYEGPFCAVQRQDMFQRMELSLDKLNEKDIEENEMLRNTSLAKINASHVEKELVMSLFNKTYFKRCLLMDHEFVCHLLENCKESLNCEKYMDEQQRHTQLNFYFILVVFIIGVFIGCVLALCCCQAIVYCRMDKQRARRRRVYEQESYNNVQLRNMDSQGQRARQGQGYSSGRERDTQSTTVDSGDRALVESNGFHDFVNDLFSRRRSRRQMMSAIGQQGTNLVRALSRSSMNLLRRSQSRAANANARAAGPQLQTPTTPIYEPVEYPPPRERSRSFTYSSEQINHSGNNNYLIEDLLRQQRRSESPPPSYQDLCVSIPKDGYVSE